MSEWIQCDCERGYYDPDEYHTCYECFQDRRSEYLSCIFCGRWHSPKYDTCYQCRRSPHREEAARVLRYEILLRDNFMCQSCRSQDLEIDHIKPCASGGTADPWNLQVLCHDCNRVKGRTWGEGSRYHKRRIHLMTWYFTFWWRMLDEEQRDRLVKDASVGSHRECFEYRARFRERMGLPVSAFPDDMDVEAYLTGGAG